MMNRVWIVGIQIAICALKASAGVAYVDFGPSGDMYADGPEYYNNFSNTGTLNLVGTNGASSGITLQYSRFGGTYNYASGTDRAPVDGISTDVTTDRLYAGTGGTANVGAFGFTLTISGLDPDGSCSITALPSPTGISSTWSVETGTGDPAEYVQDGATADNIFEWSGIIPDTNGTVVIAGRAFSTSKWKSVGLSGLMITAVPAPLSVGLSWDGNTNVAVHAQGLNADHQYALEVSTNLVKGMWEPVGDTVFDVNEYMWNGGALAPLGFYRLRGQDQHIDMERVRDQFVDFYRASAAEDSVTRNYLEDLQPDGTWEDVDYASTARASWPTTLHLSRLLSMAQSYADPSSVYYQDSLMLQSILAGLQHWLDEDYKNSNWFTWKISVPLYFLRTFTLLGDDLPAAMYSQARWQIFSSTAMDMTGANQVSLATKVFLIGLLDEDVSLMKSASDVLWNELYVTNDEGIQPDGSFHQHGPQQQFGNYGLAMTGSLIGQGIYMRETMHALSADKLEILRHFLLNGESWILWNGRMDISGLGRMIYPDAQALKGAALMSQLTDMIRIDPAAAAQYEQVLAPTNTLVGHRSFWRSDMAVHRRPDWYSSVKMCSTRVVGTETANNQNLQGIHLADGVQYLYQTGDEYENVMGLWDWHRLPGTTCDQGNHSLKPKGYDKDYGGSAFVGVLNDGTNGVAAMIYTRNALSAKKAWFFGAHSVVCLGAGIDGTPSGPVYTSVQQSRLIGPVVSDAGSLNTGTNTLSAGSWVQHNGVGYHLQSDSVVHFDTVTGNWLDINSTFDDGPVTGEVFSIWIDHGLSPSGAGYAYTIYPRTGASEMGERVASDPSVILSNTEQLQAIEIDGRIQAVFYAAGQVTGSDGTVIEVDTPCILSLNGRQLMVAEPTQTQSTVTVTVNGRSYVVLLPSGGQAGSAVPVSMIQHLD